MLTKPALAIALSIAALAPFAACKSHPDDAKSADNTGHNKTDPGVTTPTADKAVTASGDLDMTQKIRKAIESDGSLGTNAHNCKVVVQDGKVTLLGPVASATESSRVQQLAAGVIGDANVINKLEVSN